MIHLRRLYAHNFKQLQEVELNFPERARILVQGNNEAGKSTLFEAIFFALFGAALVTETGSRSLDDLIRYGIEKTEVELDAQVGARLFKIRRKIVRGKSNLWELDVEQDGALLDEIRGNTAVNKRLIGELGFDADALLNTCFVEQKKLEKLEGLSKAKREESLAKLLNLDALLNLETEIKVSGDDKRDLERLRRRADLARTQQELPARESELRTVEGKLALIELRGALEGAIEETAAVQSLVADIRALAVRRDETAARVARLEQLRDAMVNVKAALDATERADENAREAERLRAQANEMRRLTQDAPKLAARARALSRLSRQLHRLDQIRTAQQNYTERAEKLAGVENRILELRGLVEQEQASLFSIDNRAREYEIGEVLGDWIGAQRAKGSIISVDLAQSARDRILRRLRLEVIGLTAIVLIFFALGSVALLQTILSPNLFLQITTAAGFFLAVLTFIGLGIRATILWRALARAAEELGQARAMTDAREVNIARAQESTARLAQLGVTVPETIDLAQSRRVMIAREMGNLTGDELRAVQTATRERLLNARAVLSELQNQTALTDRENIAAARSASERARDKAARILSQWVGRMDAAAAKMEAPADAASVQRVLFQLEAKIDQMDARANDAAKLEQEITRREEQVKNLRARANEALGNARAVGAHLAGAVAQAPLQTAEDLIAYGKNLRKEYDALGGEQLVKQAREIEGELGRREGERATRGRNAQLLIDRVKQLVAKVGGDISDAPSLSDLQDLHKRFDSLKLDKPAILEIQQRELVGRVRSLQDQQKDLERELGLAGESLIRAECESELTAKQRAIQVRDRGTTIVSVARRRIVQKVLPATMDYMRQILPTLTRDRYHDAQLDDETYKIQVWDERANNANGQGGAFKEKNIFSGGTKDQFSLALRLAFALATLPQERGTAPSFIFLDEPLGSFDDERAQALIYLLTEGEIAQVFDQIFLISHVRVDEQLFSHRILMENGRVGFTDLPGENDTEASEKPPSGSVRLGQKEEKKDVRGRR